MKFVKDTDVGIIGRGSTKNVVLCRQDRSIVISSDILKTSGGTEIESLQLDAINQSFSALANDIHLYSILNSTREPESMVYGEALVKLLTWIIETLMTHKHPPNAPPLQDWFPEARKKMTNMTKPDVGIVNKHVRSR